ncbi:hypothetical protein AMECASPLE_032649 [Ameca splendens]|uniref:Uncharacterized protein n=1 Tax=Ameca splendens TaxID=208324 RepID=A0ABV0YUY5_9TELE
MSSFPGRGGKSASIRVRAASGGLRRNVMPSLSYHTLFLNKCTQTAKSLLNFVAYDRSHFWIQGFFEGEALLIQEFQRFQLTHGLVSTLTAVHSQIETKQRRKVVVGSKIPALSMSFMRWSSKIVFQRVLKELPRGSLRDQKVRISVITAKGDYFKKCKYKTYTKFFYNFLFAT